MVQRKKRAAKSVKKATTAPRKRIKIAKGLSLKRGEESKLAKRKGSSNVGEYKSVAKGKFCGPSGGAAAGTYPVNSKKRCTAARAYAHNAPNPSGIKSCVDRKCGKSKSAKRGK